MRTDLNADPFHERTAPVGTRVMPLLGGDFHFDSNSEALLHMVDAAFGGLPAPAARSGRPRFEVSLRLLPTHRTAHPPPPSAFSGAGFLGAATASSNLVLLSPAQRRAQLFISAALLKQPYLIRYEYLEFAVYTLASRARGLLPLHGACIGCAGRGILALGDSGAGKSTLALHALLGGYQVLAEDAVFVDPVRLRATAIANFLHVRAASLRSLKPSQRVSIRRAPLIRRRSGIVKYEVDLRPCLPPAARECLDLKALVFLSTRTVRRAGAMLRAVEPADALRRFMRMQPYATSQPHYAPAWRRLVLRLPCVELRRGAHPVEALSAVDQLLRRR